jgi:hypothetical protein
MGLQITAFKPEREGNGPCQGWALSYSDWGRGTIRQSMLAKCIRRPAEVEIRTSMLVGHMWLTTVPFWNDQGAELAASARLRQFVLEV